MRCTFVRTFWSIFRLSPRIIKKYEYHGMVLGQGFQGKTARIIHVIPVLCIRKTKREHHPKSAPIRRMHIHKAKQSAFFTSFPVLHIRNVSFYMSADSCEMCSDNATVFV